MADENKNEDAVKDTGKEAGADTGTKETKDGAGKAADTFTIKVNGEERTVNLEELTSLAQKSAGADAKFEEAAKKTKEAQEGIHFRSLMTKIQDANYKPTEAEARELSGLLGVEPDEILAYLKNEGDDEVGDNDNSTNTDRDPGVEFSKSFQAEFGRSPAEVKEILNLSHVSHINEARKQIRAASDSAVDKDDVLGKMMIGAHAKERGSVIKDMVAEDVLRKIQDGEPYGPELVAASTQKVRAYLKKFGTPGAPDLHPITMGQGPSVGLPAEVQSETPIKRIGAAEDGDEENFVNRMMQKGLKLLRNTER